MRVYKTIIFTWFNEFEFIQMSNNFSQIPFILGFNETLIILTH